MLITDRKDNAMIIDSLKYNGLCTCGKAHKMETVLSVVEGGCLKNIRTYLQQYGLTGCTAAVYDENTYRATADRHPQVDFEIILPFENLHANEHGVDLLLRQLPDQVKLLLAIGSGTVHDIVRYCAYQKELDFVSCPTAASVDGFCSSVAAMTWHGCKKTLTAVAPKIVIADLDIIKNAPARLAKSGFGDMVGKYIALTDWKIASILTGEFYCERIAKLTLEATEAVLKSAGGIACADESSYEKLMGGLLLSGLAMQMMGNSRPASGAEHHISHIIEMEPEGLGVHSDALHGEKVGVGTLLVHAQYRRLANLKNLKFTDYCLYTPEEIRAVFGKTADEILGENAADAAAGLTGAQIAQCWQEICNELRKLPTEKELEKVYRTMGIKASLPDIDVPAQMQGELLRCAPMVRNRLTLMRLRKCITVQERDILQTCRA